MWTWFTLWRPHSKVFILRITNDNRFHALFRITFTWPYLTITRDVSVWKSFSMEDPVRLFRMNTWPCRCRSDEDTRSLQLRSARSVNHLVQRWRDYALQQVFSDIHVKHGKFVWNVLYGTCVFDQRHQSIWNNIHWQITWNTNNNASKQLSF